MTAKRFQKRYIKKNKKVYDTWKKIPITDELNSDSLLNILSHLKVLGEIIDSNIKQSRYCLRKYMELKEENEQLKSEIEKLSYANEDLLSEKRNWQRMSEEYCKLSEKNEQLKHQLSQQEMEYATDCHRLAEENMQLQEELDYYKTKCGSLETALVQGRRAVDKEKEQRMFFVDMEKQRKMFR